jgi:hypothetical protein
MSEPISLAGDCLLTRDDIDQGHEMEDAPAFRAGTLSS